MSATVVAAFDVDGTLTTRDCVVPFLCRVAGWRSAGRTLLRSPRAVAAAARRDRDALKSVATDVALRGEVVERLDAEAREFAALVVAERMRPDTLARLRWHHGQGHRVVLVSASYEVYLEHVGAELDVDAVLATRLEFDHDGRATGRLRGPNCRAAEKARRLGSWLEEQGLARGDVTVWAYGDSAGDRELLAFADHPVWVTEPLASVAPIS